MKCKHIHKDEPEDAICEDCEPLESWVYNQFQARMAEAEIFKRILKKMKGGNKHENN